MTGDEVDALTGQPKEPGWHWIEVADHRTTHRVRWERVPDGQPDPEAEVDSPEHLAHVRDLVTRLVSADPQPHPTPTTTPETT